MPSFFERDDVAYLESQVGTFCLGRDHYMRGYRATMADRLLGDCLGVGGGLRPEEEKGDREGMHMSTTDMPIRWVGSESIPPASLMEMSRFHTWDYLQALKTRDPTNPHPQPDTPQTAAADTFNLLTVSGGEGGHLDTPAFEGMLAYCQKLAGGSLHAARLVGSKQHRVAINWSGGMHHGRPDWAAGFCYVNDCVLCILDLFSYEWVERVLYVDIDVHHGDGVEEAFYTTDKVMTVSFHKFGHNFFPKTGTLRDVGIGKGRGFAVNVPLDSGIDDQSYQDIFESVMSAVRESFDPSAVVMQCGADSLAGDRIGTFNLTIDGAHSKAVEFISDSLRASRDADYYDLSTGWTIAPALVQNANSEESLAATLSAVLANLGHVSSDG